MNSIDSYVKKIDSALQGGGAIKISNFFSDHLKARPVLHPKSHQKVPDMSALVYSLLRLPSQILSTERVFLGQSDKVFSTAGFIVTAPAWRAIRAIARRRKSRYHERSKTLAIFIASFTDVLDVVTILTALAIELHKLHALTRNGKKLADCFAPADFNKIKEITGPNFASFAASVTNPPDWTIRLLAGSWVDYSKAVQQWWINIAKTRKHHPINVYTQPIYFVSSNSHSLINILSGFPVKEQKRLYQQNAKRLESNRTAFTKEAVATENICYYLSRFTERQNPGFAKAKKQWEEKYGLLRLAPFHDIDIEAQIFSIRDVMHNPHLDARLKISAAEKKRLRTSNALIINIAYPLGLSAYHILDEVSENATAIRGVYVMGKAASLNATVGDITIPEIVFDQHTNNTIFTDNILTPQSFSRYFPKRSIFSRQKAISVRGTFLQNEQSLKQDRERGYSIIEMEAGPYLNRVYEMQNPHRFPTDANIVLKPPFRLGIAYYVSDTPHNKGVNLGSKRLTWEGLNATYGISLGIIKDILNTESRHHV